MVWLSPIGMIQSPFKEKFGIPRQPGLTPEAKATLNLLPPYDQPEAVRGLDAFSHIWLTFIFHANLNQQWKPTVRPPRLGGNQRIGVFATRSPVRPNPIGLSAVRLESISYEAGGVQLHLAGIDLLNGTPVIDIKPYLPYTDHIDAATSGFAPEAPAPTLTIEFSAEALAQCEALEATHYPNLRQLLVQLLEIDPRPAYYGENAQKTQFGFRLYDFDVKWEVQGDKVIVTEFVQ